MNKLIQINPSLLVSVQFVELKMVFPLKINFFSFSFFLGNTTPQIEVFELVQTYLEIKPTSSKLIWVSLFWHLGLIRPVICPSLKLMPFFLSSECKKSSS